jgi:hypothetical protein
MDERVDPGVQVPRKTAASMICPPIPRSEVAQVRIDRWS